VEIQVYAFISGSTHLQHSISFNRVCHAVHSIDIPTVHFVCTVLACVGQCFAYICCSGHLLTLPPSFIHSLVRFSAGTTIHTLFPLLPSNPTRLTHNKPQAVITPVCFVFNRGCAEEMQRKSELQICANVELIWLVCACVYVCIR
jgi:hypothetical protein